jgi:diacylglycerol kinase (ATP)
MQDHTIDPGVTCVVANPAAAGGRVGREWASIETLLHATLGEVRCVHTAALGDGIRLAEEAVRSGCTTVLSLGGDGTHNEVVNGIMRAQDAPGSVTFGVLPAGTGGDFRRVLRDSDELAPAARAMVDGKRALIDVGEAIFTTADGGEGRRYFVNLASTGLSGRVVRLVNQSSKRLGGKLTFMLATLRALVSYRPPTVRVSVDGEVVGDFRVTNVIAGNGRYAGGGMCLAPGARLSDGKLRVVVIQDAPLLTSLRYVPTIYKGTHIDTPMADVFDGAEVRVELLDGEAPWIDVDGESPGAMPVTFRVHPRAIGLINPKDEVL